MYTAFYVFIRSWFFGDISRVEAEEILMQPFVHCGSFLIRKSGNKSEEYSLSLRNLKRVNHFKINRLNESFCLTPKTNFESISELVAHYNEEHLEITNHQHVKLKNICLLEPHTVDLSRENRRGWETSKKSICRIKKIGTGRFSEVWEGIWNNHSPVAVKMLKMGTLSTKAFLREAELLKKLR